MDATEAIPGGPRPAATVIVARPSLGGPEVLVMRRGSKSRFLPGYVVFPGGAVEPQDVGLAERWFGDPREVSRACAVRELIEEVGLAITGEGLRGDADSNRAALSSVGRAPPRPEALPQVSRWIAPEEVPVRFDARFFAVESPPGLEARVDGAEAAHAWWARPADVLTDLAAGRCELYWPTYKVMQALARCATVAELLALDVPQIEDDDEGVDA